MSLIWGWMIVTLPAALALIVYLLPSLIAEARSHESRGLLISINLLVGIAGGLWALFGFTVLGLVLLAAGWLAALIWACSGSSASARPA